MSSYRTIRRALHSDVHHVAEHVDGPRRIDGFATEPLPAIDWSVLRKARPVDVMLPLTALWIDNLPYEVRPEALAETFPHIANTLALLSPETEALRDYIGELLIDRRGNRPDFPSRSCSTCTDCAITTAIWESAATRR